MLPPMRHGHPQRDARPQREKQEHEGDVEYQHAHLKGIEPPTCDSGGRRSVQ